MMEISRVEHVTWCMLCNALGEGSFFCLGLSFSVCKRETWPFLSRAPASPQPAHGDSLTVWEGDPLVPWPPANIVNVSCDNHQGDLVCLLKQFYSGSFRSSLEMVWDCGAQEAAVGSEV